LESSFRTDETWVLCSSQHREQVKPTTLPPADLEGIIYLHLPSRLDFCVEKLLLNDSVVHNENLKKIPAVTSRFTAIFIPDLQKSDYVGHIVFVGFSG